MSFAETCLRRTCYAFAAGNTQGRNHVEWWIHEAMNHGFILVNELEPPSLVTLIMHGEPVARDQAYHELLNRGENAGSIGLKLLQSQPLGLSEWLHVALLDDDPFRRMFHFEAIWKHFGPSLTDFVSRLRCVNLAVATQYCQNLIHDTYANWFNLPVRFEPPASNSLLCTLYRQCIQDTPRGVFNHAGTDWWNILEENEQMFLTGAYAILDKRQFVILLATVYGQSTTRELASIFATVPPNGQLWTSYRVAAFLRLAWQACL